MEDPEPVEHHIKTIQAMSDAYRAGLRPHGMLRAEMVIELQDALGKLRDADLRVQRETFVRRVNELLKALCVRQVLPSGELCTLRLNKPDGPPGYIQFWTVGGRSRSRLGMVPVHLICSAKIRPGRKSQKVSDSLFAQ